MLNKLILNYRAFDYSADSFVAGEQPTASKWNKLWTNDASFNDGSGLGDGTIKDTKLTTNPATFRKEVLGDLVASGCVWSTSVNLTTSMTAGVAYINGKRFVISSIASKTFTASKDTYVDLRDNLDNTYTVVYTEQTNGGGAPAVASNSMRIWKVVSDGDNVTGVTDLRVMSSNRMACGYISASTLQSTGKKTVTGLGFKPRLVQFFMNKTAIGEATGGWGGADGTNQFCHCFNRIGGGGATENAYGSTSKCMAGILSSTTPDLLCTFLSMDDDGFSYNVDTATNRYNFSWVAYK